MESTFHYSPAELPAAQAWAGAQLTSWGVGDTHVSRWLRRGAELLGEDRAGQAVLCWDPADCLLSLDVYCEGARIFGMDDLI